MAEAQKLDKILRTFIICFKKNIHRSLGQTNYTPDRLAAVSHRDQNGVCGPLLPSVPYCIYFLVATLFCTQFDHW